MKVGLDLDNVLFDINTAARLVLADHLGIDACEIVETEAYDVPFTHADPAIAAQLQPPHGFWERPEVLEQCTPLPGAVAAAWRLFDAGFLGGYITRRPPIVQSLTASSLARFEFPPITVHHVGHDDAAHHYTRCKSTACLASGVTHMIDDQAREAARLRAAGIHVVLVDAPAGRIQRQQFLRHHPDMPVAADVGHAVDVLLNEIKAR